MDVYSGERVVMSSRSVYVCLCVSGCSPGDQLLLFIDLETILMNMSEDLAEIGDSIPQPSKQNPRFAEADL